LSSALAIAMSSASLLLGLLMKGRLLWTKHRLTRCLGNRLDFVRVLAHPHTALVTTSSSQGDPWPQASRRCLEPLNSIYFDFIRAQLGHSDLTPSPAKRLFAYCGLGPGIFEEESNAKPHQKQLPSRPKMSSRGPSHHPIRSLFLAEWESVRNGRLAIYSESRISA
jgi:hypothetical protein